MKDLTGKKIAIIATDYFEESELIEPLTQLRDMGAEVVVAAPHDETIQALRHVDMGQEVSVDMTIAQLDPTEYDAVVIPGGVVNADHLRTDKDAQESSKIWWTAKNRWRLFVMDLGCWCRAGWSMATC